MLSVHVFVSRKTKSTAIIVIDLFDKLMLNFTPRGCLAACLYSLYFLEAQYL